MKLKNIIDQYSLITRISTNGCIIVEAPIGTEYRHHLFGLTDYVVSGCAGDMVWLNSRDKN